MEKIYHVSKSEMARVELIIIALFQSIFSVNIENCLNYINY